MIQIHHLNCGTLQVPGYPTVVCHCLLLQEGDRLTLVDTGIGMQDVLAPYARLGQQLIEMAGFQFHAEDTAVQRITAAGFDAAAVQHVVLTHADPDHAGGLADFPQAQVHISEEEKHCLERGHWRYVPIQFAHGVHWQTCGASTTDWFGLESRPLHLGFSEAVLLIPLPGHTPGHCGVAIPQGDRWLLHVGDAYYLRAELFQDDHPVSQVAAQRADNDDVRRQSLMQLRRLQQDHSDQVDLIGYHDLAELPPNYPLPAVSR